MVTSSADTQMTAIYVQSRSSGERVMKSITSFHEQRLTDSFATFNRGFRFGVSEWPRNFRSHGRATALFSAFTFSPKRLKGKLREIFRRGQGRIWAS